MSAMQEMMRRQEAGRREELSTDDKVDCYGAEICLFGSNILPHEDKVMADKGPKERLSEFSAQTPQPCITKDQQETASRPDGAPNGLLQYLTRPKAPPTPPVQRDQEESDDSPLFPMLEFESESDEAVGRSVSPQPIRLSPAFPTEFCLMARGRPARTQPQDVDEETSTTLDSEGERELRAETTPAGNTRQQAARRTQQFPRESVVAESKNDLFHPIDETAQEAKQEEEEDLEEDNRKPAAKETTCREGRESSGSADADAGTPSSEQEGVCSPLFFSPVAHRQPQQDSEDSSESGGGRESGMARFCLGHEEKVLAI
ncbi:MAG: hypothetical protein ACX936_21585, partial [Marinobacter sp.]